MHVVIRLGKEDRIVKNSLSEAVRRTLRRLASLIRQKNGVITVTHDEYPINDHQPTHQYPGDSDPNMDIALAEVRKHKAKHPTDQLAAQMQAIGSKSSLDR